MPKAAALAREFPLSYSRISTFACPYRAAQLYLEGRKEAESIPLLRGSLCHDFAARYVTHCREAGVESDLDALPDLFRAAWEAGKVPAEEMDLCKDHCRKLVSCISVNSYTAAEVKTAVDKDWNRTEFFGSGILLRGVIDRIDVDGNAGVITDYSFGWGPALEKKLQLKIYVALASVLYPEVETWWTTILVVPTGQATEAEFTIEDIPRLRRDIESEIRRILAIVENAKFPAAPGDHCGFCGFVSECPAGSVSALSLGSPDSAIEAAGKLIVVEQEAARLKGMLKAYTGSAGPLEVGGMVVGHHPTATKVYDKQLVYSAATEAGLDPLGYFNVDSRRVGKLGVEPVSVKAGVRFGLKKAGQGDDDAE